MQLTQPLHKGLWERPGGTATVFRARRRTYAQLAGRVAQLAGALQQLGVGRGDRVGLLGLNSDTYIEAVYAVFWAGAVINPVNIRWNPAEIAYSLDDCDTTMLLVDDAFAALVPALREQSKSLRTVVFMGESELPPETLRYESLLTAAAEVADARRRGDDLAAVMYTSGTTGKPKGVMLSHANIYTDALGAVAASSRLPLTVALHAAPLFHIGGLSLVFQLAARLGTHVILPMFEPQEMLETIARERVSETFLVPTMLRLLLDHPEFERYDLSSLRYLIYGASPIDAALLDRALRLLPQVAFMQAYGMTELSPVITMLPAWYHTAEGRQQDKLDSAGLPVNIAEVRIVDSDDQPVPPGMVGEIVARGPMVMQGYWNKPEQTAAVLRDGWMHTGDAGYMDADGFVYVVDRIKDMIISGGENVYSAEVESAILQLPEVVQCAVIGVPDERWGERVHAVLVLKPGSVLELEELTAHCKRLIAGYKCPRSLEIRDQLPMSGAGKLLKYKLREPYWQGQSRRVG